MPMSKNAINEYMSNIFNRMTRVLESQLDFSIQVIQNNDVQNTQTMQSIQSNTEKILESVKRV